MAVYSFVDCVTAEITHTLTLNLVKFCSGPVPFHEKVYGLRYGGEAVWFDDLKGCPSDSSANCGRWFDDRTLVEFIGETHSIYSSMGKEPYERHEFLTGFLFQLAEEPIKIETDSFGELVKFHVPSLKLLFAFSHKLHDLLNKLYKLDFITEPREEE